MVPDSTGGERQGSTTITRRANPVTYPVLPLAAFLLLRARPSLGLGEGIGWGVVRWWCAIPGDAIRRRAGHW